MSMDAQTHASTYVHMPPLIGKFTQAQRYMETIQDLNKCNMFEDSPLS